MEQNGRNRKLVAVTAAVAAAGIFLSACSVGRTPASAGADGHSQTSQQRDFASKLTECTVAQERLPRNQSTQTTRPSTAPEEAGPPEVASDPDLHRFCADIEVSTPAGRHVVRVGVLSSRAADPFEDREPLVYHPGGPGLDPVKMLFNDPPRVDLADFTVVTWAGDTAGSGPGACGPASLDFGHSRTVTLRGVEAIGAECEQRVDAVSGAAIAAAELEGVLRQLGVARVSLLTHSYGTAVAEAYLARDSERVTRAVLDGPVGLEVPWASRSEAVSAAVRAVVPKLMSTCGRDSCGPKPVRDYLELRAAVEERAPMVGTSSLRVTATDLDQATLTALRSREYWSGWRVAVKEALSGDGTNLYRMSERYWVALDRAAYWGAVCTDIDHPDELAAYGAGDPLVDAYLTELSPCLRSTWRRPAPLPDGSGSPQVLVVASKYDVLTPARLMGGAPGLRSAGSMCITDVMGHTSIADAGVRRLVTRFLLGKASASAVADACKAL